jgi:predicted PurR-regulated permease PerM
VRIRPVPGTLDRAAGWSWRIIVCAITLAAVLALLWYLRVIVLPTLVALTIAPALTPLASRLRRLRLERPAAGIALTVGILVVAGLIALVTTSVASDYDELADAVARGVDDLIAWLEGEPFNLSLDRIEDLDASLGDAWGEASSYLVSGLSTGVALLTGLILAVALLYFVLRDGALFWRWIVDRFSAENAAAVDRAGRRAWQVLGGYIRGTALIAAIDATLIGIGLWILGVPLAFPLAILIFLGSFIPFVGATISGLIAVLVAFADEGWETALIALGIVVGVQLIEGNFLQPIIQSRTVDLHPAVILLAVAAGGSLFGIIGAYLAVPVTAVVFAMIASLHAEHEGAQPAPTESPPPSPT